MVKNMSHSKGALIIIMLLLLSSLTSANSFPANSPLGRGEHPRIWVTSDNIAEIRARISQGGGLHADALAWRAWLDSNFNRTWTYDQRSEAVLHYAFAYLMKKDGPLNGLPFQYSATEYAMKAKKHLMDYYADNYIDASAEASASMLVTYDWIHPFFNYSERAYILNALKPIDKIKDPNVFDADSSSRRFTKLITGISFYGDGVDDAWALSKINAYPALFRELTGVTRSESELGGDDGGAGHGISYHFTPTIPNILIGEEAYRTAFNIPKDAHYGSSDIKVLRTKPQHFSYLILPLAKPDPKQPGGRAYLIEKNWKAPAFSTVSSYNIFNNFWLTAIAGIYQYSDPDVASLAQWLLEQRVGLIATGEKAMLSNFIFSKFIMGPSTRPTPKSPAELNLPLSKYFHEGKIIIRNDWNNLDSSYITILLNEWSRNSYGRSPTWPGAFQIHRKGPQVINQGGVGGHDWGSSGGVGSGNMMIFPDRSRDFSIKYDNLGGHRSGEAASAADFIQNSVGDTRDELRYSIANLTRGMDVDYVYVDITRAYSSTRYTDRFNPPRISSYTRQIVNFRPQTYAVDSDRMIIFDRATTTDTKYSKEWLFHTAGEPMVNGIQSPGPARNGSTEGKWTYTGATEVTATNTVAGSNGKTYLTPLFPENRVIIKVGGPNASGFSWKEDSHEYENPYGVHDPYKVVPGTAERDQYVGRYRIEITPATPSLYDSFLNVIEVGDAGFGRSPTSLVEGANFIGARVGDRIAVFSRLEQNLTQGSFTIPIPGTYKVLIADLHKFSQYTITHQGTTQSLTTGGTATLYATITTTQPSVPVSIQATGLSTPPPGVSFSSSQSSIFRGQPVTLSWITTGAQTINILPEVGLVAPNGQAIVYPSTTTSYTLTATNTAGTATQALTVTVSNPPVNITPQPGTEKDSDGDGVPDYADKCFRTGFNRTQVNIFGCPKPLRTKFSSSLTTDFENVDLLGFANFRIGVLGVGLVDYKSQAVTLLDQGFNPANLDAIVTFQNRLVRVNTTLYPSLNKPATVALYGVKINNPVIYRDGLQCTTCRIQEFSNNTIAFTVPGFSTFTVEEGSYCGDSYCSAQETCLACLADCCPSAEQPQPNQPSQPGSLPTQTTSPGGSSGGGASAPTPATPPIWNLPGGSLNPSEWVAPESNAEEEKSSALQNTCSQDWQCSSWSECKNGFKSRQCKLVSVTKYTQDAACPSFNRPPTTVSPCNPAREDDLTLDESLLSDASAKKQESPEYFLSHYVLLGIMSLLIIAGILHVLRFGSRNALDDIPPPESVVRYIKDMRLQGRGDSEIKEQLAKAGWDVSQVKRFLRKK
jgi:hypothetical protein